MDEERKVRVTISQNNPQDKKHDLEHYLTPKNSSNRPRPSKGEMLRFLKPVMFAIILGLLFGGGLMYFFSDMTAEAPSESANGVPVSTAGDNDEEEEEQSEESSSALEVEQRQLKLIQYGLFAEAQNANEHVADLRQAGIPSFAIQSDGSYYVVGTYLEGEAEEAEAIRWLEERDMERLEDFLIKDWMLPQVSIEESEAVITWLEEGQATFRDDNTTGWESWLVNVPETIDESAYFNTIEELVAQHSGDSLIATGTVYLSYLFFLHHIEN